MKCCNQNCHQGRDCQNRKKEDKFAMLITAIIAVMVVLLTLRSCYE